MPGAELRGRVRDAHGGEYLARVIVDLDGLPERRTVTGEDGSFVFQNIPARTYILRVETVGYWALRQQISVQQETVTTCDVILNNEIEQLKQSVDVNAGPWALEAPITGPAGLDLRSTEIRNLSTVLMNDPIRAVGALPGVASNNDFQSQFTMRAAGFDRIGFYLDGILMHDPFHGIAADESNSSLSMLNGDMVEDMSLIPMGYGPRYADRSAGALDVQTRNGNRNKRSVHGEAGMVSATVVAEGPLAGGRGSWIVSARKSFLQYIMPAFTTDTTIAIAFQDVQGKVTYDLTPKQRVSLYVLNGTTDLDRSRAKDQSGVDAIIYGLTRGSMAKADWHYTPSGLFEASASVAWLRDEYNSRNRDDRSLDQGNYNEWTGVARATRFWNGANALELGWSTRSIRDAGLDLRYFNNSSSLYAIGDHRGTAQLHGGYAQESWSIFGGRLRGTVGTRVDTHNWYPGAIASPVASLAWRMGRGPELQLGWGQYVQFPAIELLGSPYRGSLLAPERANHMLVAVEQHIGPTLRVRVEGWNRDDRDLIARPFQDPRMIAGTVSATGDLSLFNAIRGYSRGMQLMLQRRSANRLSGWVGYTLNYSRQRDAVDGTRFWAPDDQRHIANLYLSYRLRPTLNVSTRYSYASGVPLPGFFALQDGTYYLSGARNAVRLPSYSRLDFRTNKSFTYDRWQLTLYAELINAINQKNYRLVSFDGASRSTGQALLTIDRVFPILPVAGITLAF